MRSSALGQFGAMVCAAAALAACSADDQTLPLIGDGDVVRIVSGSTDGCPNGWSDAGFDDAAWQQMRLPIAAVQSAGLCLRKEFDISAPLDRYRWLKIRLSTRTKAQLNPNRPVTVAEERGGIDWSTDDDDSAPATASAAPSPTREFSLDLRLFPTLLQAVGNVLALEVPQTRQELQIDVLLQKDDGSDDGSAAVQRGPYLVHPTATSVQIAWEAGRASPSWAVVGDQRRDGGWALHHQALADALVPGHSYAYWVETGEDSVLPPECRGVATASQPSKMPDDPGADYWRYLQQRDGCKKVAAAIRTDAAYLRTPAPGGRLRLVVLGDTRAHGDTAPLTAAVLQAAALEAPDLLVHTGDLVSSAAEADWQSFFDAGKALWANVPIAPVAGERDLGPWVDRFGQLFALDAGGAAGRSYTIDLGGVHLALLDDAAPMAAVAAWLDADLTQAEAAGATHTFVVLHHGPYSSGMSQGSLQAVTQLVPVLARHAVDAVLSGHDNLYDHQLVDGRHYFVTGGAGPTSDAQPTPGRSATSLVARAQTHYLVIDVTAGGVTVQAKDTNGQPFDTVTLGN
jgi:predicted phosphodiesterase